MLTENPKGNPDGGLEYAKIVKENQVQHFFLKFDISEEPVRNLIIISPFVSTIRHARVPLERICRKLDERQIQTHVITRTPKEEYQRDGVEILRSCGPIELRYNDNLHAKLYMCICEDETRSYALLGSANLTRNAMEKNIEIGIMIYGHGKGRDLLSELSRWGLERLRTLSKVEKRIGE